MPYFVKETNGSPLNGLDLSDSDKPFFTDLDGDGKIDLLIGTESGEFKAYRNTDSGYSLFDRDFAGLTGKRFENITSATFADIDGDGDGDAMIRLANGKVQVLQNNAGSFFSIGDINTDLVAENNPFQQFSEFENFMTNLGLLPDSAASQSEVADAPVENPLGRITASSDFVYNAGWASQNQYLRKLADVNGDGRIDIIAFGHDQIFTALGQADGTFGQTTIASAAGHLSTEVWRANPNSYLRTIGDINGDGRADIVGFASQLIFAQLGRADGTFSAAKIISKDTKFTSYTGWNNNDRFPRLLGDINGDGRDDIVAFGPNMVWSKFTTPDGELTTNQYHAYTTGFHRGWEGQNKHPRFLADVNGDGRADIVGFHQDRTYVALSRGVTFANALIADHYFTIGNGWTSQSQTPRQVVDVNGDGRADIVGFRNGTAFVAHGLSNGTFKPAIEVPELALTSGADGLNLERNPFDLADVNGDGQVDLIEFTDDAVQVGLTASAPSSSSPTTPSSTPSPAAPTEPTQVTPEPIYHENASGAFVVDASSSFTHDEGWSSQNEFPRRLADVNGDGRVDIVGFGQEQVFTALGREDGTFGPMAIASADSSLTQATGWSNQNQYPRHVADMNGDGYADIVGFGRNRIHLQLGRSDGTFDPAVTSSDARFTLLGGWHSQDRYPRLLGDVNGDGKTDIVAFGHGSVYVKQLQSDGSWANHNHAYRNWLAYATGWDSQERHLRQVADVNGDGRADIIGFHETRVYVALGQSNATFANPIIATYDFSHKRGWSSQSQHPRRVIDINGDGRADIVGLLDGATLVAFGQADGTFAPMVNASDWALNLDGEMNPNQNPFDIADINNDGRLDLVQFNDDAVQVSLGRKQEVTYADLDNDGDHDKLVNHGDDKTFDIYLNNGGSYVFDKTVEAIAEINAPATEDQESAAATSPPDAPTDSETSPSAQPQVAPELAPTFGDLDGDGDLDALVGHRNGNVDIYLNEAGESILIGTLESVGKDAKPALGDLDSDGDLDVLVGNAAGQLKYYQNQTELGNGFVRRTGDANPFQYVDVGYDAQPTFADLDNDGDADLVVIDREGELHHFDSRTITPSLSNANIYGSKDFTNYWGWTSNNRNPRYLADINGDGHTDIVGFGVANVHVALGRADGKFGNAVPVSQDFTERSWGWSSNNRNPRHLTDVNGDGRADIVGFGVANIYVALGTAEGEFEDAVAVGQDFTERHGGWNSNHTHLRQLADVNGDGRADIIAFGEADVHVAFGQTDGSFEAAIVATSEFTKAAGWLNNHNHPRQLADVNGDGRADIVGFGQDLVYVALGKEDGTFENAIATTHHFTEAQGWSDQNSHPRQLADMNGDGLADIVGFSHNPALVALGQTDGSFGTPTVLTSRFTHNTGWRHQDQYPRQLGDINGDGRADLVGFGHNRAYTHLNTTVSPNPDADLFFESVFTTHDRSIWSNGESFQFQWDFKEATGFEPIEWNFGNYSKKFGGFARVSSGGTEGYVDFNAGVEIDSGSINAELPIVSWFGMPDVEPSLGQSSTFKTGSFLAEDASFNTVFPYLNAYLDVDVDVNASGPSLSLDVPLLSKDPSWKLGEFDLDQALHLALDTRQGGASVEHDGTASNAAKAHQANETKNELSLLLETKDRKTDEKKSSQTAKKGRNTKGKFDLSRYLDFEMPSLEDMDLTSLRQDDFTLVATNRQPVFETRIDVDNILTTPLPFDLEYSGDLNFGVGSVFGEINLFDTDLVAEFTVDQKFTLEVTQVDGLFTFENGSTQAFKLGDEVDVLLAAGIVDANGDNHADIDVTLTPQVTLRNQTDILYDLELELSALSGAAGFDVGIDLGILGSISYEKSTSLGPAWSQSIDLHSGSIYNYDKTFTLDGFGSQSYELTIPV